MTLEGAIGRERKKETQRPKHTATYLASAYYYISIPQAVAYCYPVSAYYCISRAFSYYCAISTSISIHTQTQTDRQTDRQTDTTALHLSGRSDPKSLLVPDQHRGI